jgi:hypothetical protein
MQAVDGQDSSQLEWHQIGVKTNAPDTKIRLATVSGGKVRIDPPDEVPLRHGRRCRHVSRMGVSGNRAVHRNHHSSGSPKLPKPHQRSEDWNDPHVSDETMIVAQTQH